MRCLYQAVLSFSFLFLFAFPSLACEKDYSCLPLSQIHSAQTFDQELQKLSNVVLNNDHTDHLTDNVRDVQVANRYLLRALTRPNPISYYEISVRFNDVRSRWTYVRTRLQPFTNVYQDVRLHFRKTQDLFTSLGNNIATLLRNYQ